MQNDEFSEASRRQKNKTSVTHKVRFRMKYWSFPSLGVFLYSLKTKLEASYEEIIIRIMLQNSRFKFTV